MNKHFPQNTSDVTTLETRRTCPKNTIQAEQELVALCFALIEAKGQLSVPERKIAKAASALVMKPTDIEAIREAISRGMDPLGEAFSSIRSSAQRRSAGAVYQPVEKPTIFRQTD